MLTANISLMHQVLSYAIASFQENQFQEDQIYLKLKSKITQKNSMAPEQQNSCLEKKIE